MPPVLDDLLTDGRLARLFSADARYCALQLWILQIKTAHAFENRIVYGRLLPYSHFSNRWTAIDDDNFRPFGQVQAQVVRINLYVESTQCADILCLLSAGRSISEISEALPLELSERLKSRLGGTALPASALAYRPVAYLLNRDAHERHSLASPHGGAGAFSASIVQTNKEALFRLEEGYDMALTGAIVKHLNAETGLDFGHADTNRFGDLELLVFPALDDLERPLLSVDWSGAPRALVVRFDPSQVPHFGGFQFVLRITNDDQIIYAEVASAESTAEGAFEYRFAISDQMNGMIDSTEIEIFGLRDKSSGAGTLCCRWRVSYVREIHLQGHMVGNHASPVKFDWLERTTKPSASERVKAALTIKQNNLGFTNRIGKREADPWVPVNRDLTSLFKRLHPPQSEGLFFPRWGPSNGEGRLQFTEWFKALLAKYQQHQVIIFDPYFETAGLGLLQLSAAPGASYLVFRSLPKKQSSDGEAALTESAAAVLQGFDNLMASCERNSQSLKRFNLRLYGLKPGRLHDRYVLVVGSDGLPVAGFNLSNSLQLAAENHPLLVTPIPTDALLKVEQYKSALLEEAKTAQAEGETENSYLRLLFDSTASPAIARHYDPLYFLEKSQAGDVLSVWTDEPSLGGLSGDSLKEQLTTLGFINDGSLALRESAGLYNCLGRQAGDFADFTKTWEVLGEILAHSHVGDHHFHELESEQGFLRFLAQFLDASFDRAHHQPGGELTVMSAKFFSESTDSLMSSSYRLHQVVHPIKYAALTWPEFFAVKLLWHSAPDALLSLVEAQLLRMPVEPEDPDMMRWSLLSQIASDVARSIQLGIGDVQRDRLIRSSNGLLRWMGLSAIEQQLESPDGLVAVLQQVAAFPYDEQVRVLGWMVNHAARDPKRAKLYAGLVAALHKALPASISTSALNKLVDSLRGHMRELPWVEPWLFQDVILPLLRDDRASVDDACEIWVRELTTLLEPGSSREPRLFAYSSPERQQTSLKLMRALLKRPRRLVQQPLANTSNWAQWDDALTVSMWILTFARWSQYYLHERGIPSPEVESLSQGARGLAMVRTMEEWRSQGVGKWSELAAFLDQANGLLLTGNPSEGTGQ